jgi:hypothetical protein
VLFFYFNNSKNKVKKYKLTISEPWDWQDATGSNTVTGEVLHHISQRRIIFKTTSVLEFGTFKGQNFLLTTRYAGDNFSKENYEFTVGGALLLIDDFENKSEDFLEQNSKYLFIGSLKKQ